MAITKETLAQALKKAAPFVVAGITISLVNHFFFQKSPKADTQVPAQIAYVLNDADLRKQFGFSEASKLTMEDAQRFECEMVHDIAMMVMMEQGIDTLSSDVAYAKKTSTMQASLEKFNTLMEKNMEYMYGVPISLGTPIIMQASQRCMQLSVVRQRAFSKKVKVN